MSGGFHQSLAPGAVTGHVSQALERSLCADRDYPDEVLSAVLHCRWEHSESQLLCTQFALTPKFWYLAFSTCQRSPTFSCLLSPCQSPPFLWSLPYEYIGFKVVNSISFLIIKLQKYVKENALKLLMTSSSELSWRCTWLKAGWLLGVCQPKKGMIWDCLFACSLIWVLGHAMVLE